jgi:gliding motility-associated-like protein
MRYFYLLILSVFFFVPLSAQVDTSFWFVAPRVPAVVGTTSVGLQLSTYSQPATIYVRQPANVAGVNQTVTLAANTSTVLDMTASQALITSTLANAADNKGLYISATASISANYFMESAVSRENISLKGRNGIGTDFYTPFPNSLNTIFTGTAAGNNAFDIIATESGLTTLLITPRGNLIGPRPKNNTFAVNLNQGETFSCKESMVFRNPISSATGDFNGDGFNDVAMVDEKLGQVFILQGNGTGTFTETVNYKVGVLPRKIITANVNNDGFLDLLVLNFASDQISVLLGNGNGTFSGPVNYNSGGDGPINIVCTDLNGDSNNDLLVLHNQSSQLSVLTGNGLGAFTFLANYVVPGNPFGLAASDFNNDGFIDAVVSSNTGNNISIFYGAAAAALNTPATVIASGGTNPRDIVIGNFNNDAFEDIALVLRATNAVRVFTSSPTGVFTAAGGVNFAVGTNPEAITTTTVNNDGLQDIITANFTSGNVSVLINNNTTAAPAFLAHVTVPNTSGVNPTSIAFADFNNDNAMDFVTTNYNSNSYAILQGNLSSTLGPINSYSLGLSAYPPTELSGSIISADKRISVLVSGAVAGPSVCNSFYADQLTNSSKIGNHYVLHRSNTQNDIAYVFAPVNSTSITVNTSTVTNWLLNSGETFSVNTTQSALGYVQTNKPVYVLSVQGSGCRLSGAQIAPAYCAGSYTAGFIRANADSLLLNIYVRNGAQSTFTLEVNSVPSSIPAGNFSVVPGTSNQLVAARIFYNTTSIPVGAYCMVKNSADLFGFSVQNGNNANGSHLSHHTQFDSESFVNANVVSTATICSNTTFTLNGQVGGGPNTGVWSYNGFGTLSGGPNQLLNNVYTPALLDTAVKPTPTVSGWTGGLINLVLTSTGICPNKSDTLKLRVLQGPIVNAGSNQIKCTNNATIQLNATVLGASSQGTWSAVAPASGTFANLSALSNTYFPSSADTSLNSVSLVLTSINNGFCAPGRDTIQVNFQKAPLVRASLTPTLTRCTNNATVNLSGYISNNIVTGIWSTSGTGVFVPNNISLTNNYLPSLVDMANSPIKLKLTTPPSLLCKEVSDSVLVYFTQPASISAGVDLNSCKNNPIVNLNAIITGTSSNSGVWTGGTGTFVPSNAVLNPTYIATPAETSAGFVLLTVTTTSNSGGCLSTADQVRVDFQDKPTANFIANTVCLNQPTQYTDQSINTSGLGALNNWQWSFGNGGTSTQINPSVTFTTAGTYTTQLIVSNTFNCADTIERAVTVYPLPDVKVGFTRSCTGSSQLICFKDSSTISAPSSIPNTGYYWDFGGVGFSVSKDTCFVFPSEGRYSITHVVTSDNGCVSSLTETLNITPRPRAKFLFINSTGQSVGANIQFVDSSANSVSWIWNFGNGQSSNLQNPSSFYNSNGNYTVTQTVADQFGCTDTYTAVVRVLNIVTEITELIPNIITPNNDGKNDFWRLDFIDIYYPKAEIEIFNRWGESIFKSKGYSNAWDGSYKGNPLPVGVYYYTIDLKDQNKPEIIKGNITLLK